MTGRETQALADGLADTLLGSAQRGGRALAWLVLLASVLLSLAIAAGAPRITRDGSVDAFVPLDHPAAIARDRARTLFGIEDPVVIGLAAPAGGTAFSAPGLAALRDLHEALRTVPGVRARDIQSIASEKAITGTGGDLNVDTILTDTPLSPAEVAATRARFEAMPMYRDVLASADGSMLVLIVPVDDPNHAEAAVDQIRTAAERLAPAGWTVHVAGVAAMNARLAGMVSQDTRIFVPAAVLVVFGVLWLAFRSWRAIVGPLLVVALSAAAALGAMGWAGAHYYLISTALPVVVMAIAVADSVHIQSVYLALLRETPGLPRDAALAQALRRTFAPVLLTSLTTIVAFLGLVSGAGMVPIREFGLFAAVGVAAALLLSLTLLPAVMLLLRLAPAGGAARPEGAANRAIDRALAGITAAALARPRAMLGLVGAAVLAMALLAAGVRADYERQRYFTAADPVRTADVRLNAALGGINALDVAISAPDGADLMTPAALSAIADLRARIGGLPHVGRVTAIDQQIAHMHKVLTGAPADRLPSDPAAPAQYMFLYEASSAPEDFRAQIDSDQRHALIRARLGTDRFSETQPVVRQLRDVVAAWSRDTGLAGEVSGRLAVNEGWMQQLAATHWRGIAVAFAMVFLVTALALRSITLALLAMVPVGVGVLGVNAAMAAFAIDIAPATAMTAAIATGLGVDFAIHLISHVRRRQQEGASLAAAMDSEYVAIARACFWCAVALGVALATICLSSAPPLRWFGLLVAAGAFGSLFGALLLLPALFVLGGKVPRLVAGPARAAMLLPVLAGALFLAPSPVQAAPTADGLARQIWDRPAAQGRTGVMHFRLMAKSGSSRDRRAVMLHADRADGMRLAIHFEQPAAIARTAFLTVDKPGRPEDAYLFLPATERVRRIPAAQRGEAFLGTDLSYGDLRDNFRFPPDLWQFSGGETVERGGRRLLVLNGTARTPAEARAMGYGAFRALVDPASLFPVEISFDDREGRPLKRIEVRAVERIGTTWTAMRFVASNLQTGHSTEVHFTDMRDAPGLALSSFAPDRLSDGPPRLR